MDLLKIVRQRVFHQGTKLGLTVRFMTQVAGQLTKQNGPGI